jgi:hypothetical protein
VTSDACLILFALGGFLAVEILAIMVVEILAMIFAVNR